MRVAFIGGGTGGHLTPAIGIAEELLARGHQVEFWLSGRKVEANYIGDEIPHRSLAIDGSRLPRPLAVVKAFGAVRRYCREFDPQVLVSLGGYGGATALASPRRPIVCLEGNVVAGKSVKLVSRFAERVLVMFEKTALELPRATVVGPISRKSIALPSREQACQKFGFDMQRPVLLTMGGSQGAASLNQHVASMLPQLHAAEWQLLCLTGASKKQAVQEAVDACGINGVVLEHCSDMGSAYACADFMLSRGGASTLAEVWTHHLPTMVMPYMHKDRQQQLNAEQLSPGVRIFDGSQASQYQLFEILANPSERAAMREALMASYTSNGQQIACDYLEEIGQRKP
ncbi:MAG: UDP-N-acetylglucosamine--N-acetylmuramyl-(pentapeptide) pyrophosphoryl-undecaprenol N-acetylglucosamine transferase [Myxococcota bacterium]|jgi:UDP-N-acetylglucosamine--N-acetylmuramyl-(pentapeptide) pyrophosphoryl-undecaprenol N-acetylglucosamine transferase